MCAAMSPTAPRYRFGFLRNVTLEGIEPYLRYHMLTTGMRPDLVFGGYDPCVEPDVAGLASGQVWSGHSGNGIYA